MAWIHNLWKTRTRSAQRGSLLLTVTTLMIMTACTSIGGVGTTMTPGPTGTQTSAMAKKIDAYINQLSPTQQVGQLMMLAVYASEYTDALGQQLQQGQIGNAIIYTQHNGGPLEPQTLDGLRQLVRDVQSHATNPLLIATDEEGGEVDRLASYYGTSPSPEELAATGDPQQAYDQAKTDAQRLTDLGINTDFAPLADVYQGGVIDKSRMFGTTPAQVTQFAGEFLDGLQENGVAGTLKHWPGIGAVDTNPDFGLPTLDKTQDQMNALDFTTFKALLSHNPSMIMATHVIVPSFDAKYPASLSPTLIDGVLRGQLGYQGVVVTDAMEATGIADFMKSQGYDDPAQGVGEASVLAILAGEDIIECPLDAVEEQGVISAVTEAVATGRISHDRLMQSLRRIIALKVQMGLIKLP